MVTLSGIVTPAQPSPGIQTGTSVSLSYSSDGGINWSIFLVCPTDGTGAYSAVWFPPYAGTYQLKSSWSGNSNYASAVSPTATLAVTGSRPPQISLLVSGPGTAARGASVTFEVLATNPGSVGVSPVIYIEISGPGGYYFDTLQVTLVAGSTGTFQFAWQVPSGFLPGDYKISEGLIPPMPVSIARMQIAVT